MHRTLHSGCHDARYHSGHVDFLAMKLTGSVVQAASSLHHTVCIFCLPHGVCVFFMPCALPQAAESYFIMPCVFSVNHMPCVYMPCVLSQAAGFFSFLDHLRFRSPGHCVGGTLQQLLCKIA
jgi:hypothetical protein